MKFLILASLFGLSLATCSTLKSCQTCTAATACYWDVGDNKCKIFLLNSPTSSVNVVPLPLSCPTPLPAFQYNDDFGRNTAFVFAMASNADGLSNADSCVQDKFPNAHAVQQFTITCDFLGSSCSATLFDHPDENAWVLVFRGSKETAQYGIQALNFLFYISQPGPLYSGNVFSYFANGINNFWYQQGLGSALASAAASRPNSQLWAFGHSLGGSLATLAANAAVRQGIFSSDRVRVVTMGEPRTGDYQFAAEVGVNIPQTYRIVKKSDVITKLPLKVAQTQKNAYHNNFEVWYNNDMKVGDPFVINNRADDASGSNTVFELTTEYHATYFNITMSAYGPEGCAEH